jgi:hypothetical protein
MVSLREMRFVAPLLVASACGGIRIEDVQTPRTIPEDSCLVVGFLGGRDAWDDETKGVRQLALELRRHGFFAETFENRSRHVALELVRQVRSKRLVLFGQSFGGAAVVRFARDLERIAVPLELTIQIDSVGRDDGTLPPNVRNAVNLFQTDGWFLDGEHPIEASDPSRTRILGNWRFDYSRPPGSEIFLADVPWWKLAFRIPHARMDRDPEVWSFSRRLIEAACTGGEMEGIKPSSRSPRPEPAEGPGGHERVEKTIEDVLDSRAPGPPHPDGFDDAAECVRVESSRSREPEHCQVAGSGADRAPGEIGHGDSHDHAEKEPLNELLSHGRGTAREHRHHRDRAFLVLLDHFGRAHLLVARGAREQVVPRRNILPAERVQGPLLVGKLLEVAPVVTQKHVDDRADDEDENRGQ